MRDELYLGGSREPDTEEMGGRDDVKKASYWVMARNRGQYSLQITQELKGPNSLP